MLGHETEPDDRSMTVVSVACIKTRPAELLVFMSEAPASVRFHKVIFSIVLVCLKTNGNELNKVHITKRIYQTFE